jgi:hypothetical protein
MSEVEKMLAERHGALNQDGSLKNGYHIVENFVGKEEREVLQLVKTVHTQTRYGKDVFHSGRMQRVVATHFV